MINEAEFWKTIWQWDQERLKNAEVCERCKTVKPERISRISSYIAVCNKCNDEIETEAWEWSQIRLEELRREDFGD